MVSGKGNLIIDPGNMGIYMVFFIRSSRFALHILHQDDKIHLTLFIVLDTGTKKPYELHLTGINLSRI